MSQYITRSKVFRFTSFLVLATAVLATAVAAGPPAGSGEFATYRYDLVMSKDDKVCKHMQGVYNWSFTRPFDYRGFTEAEWLGSGAKSPLQSRYPTSEEFEVVPWTYPKIFTWDGKRLDSLPVAEFDIDNDGKKELVVKMPIGGAQYGSHDTLYVYHNNGLDLSQTITMQRLSQGQSKHRPRIIEAGTLLRPFILNGISYLSVYNYSGPDSPAEKGFLHQPPQTMEVKKYKGGGIHIPAEETPLEMEDICKFNMLRVPR